MATLPDELLRALVGILERLELRYFVTGSIAAIYYGEPRFTKDFFRDGGSEKHLRDITGILMVSGEHLDHAYIESWADQMGTETIWRTIKYLIRQK